MENIIIKIKLLPLPRSGLPLSRSGLLLPRSGLPLPRSGFPLPNNANANHKWPTYEYRRCWALLRLPNWCILQKMSSIAVASIAVSKWRILLLLRSRYCSCKTAEIADCLVAVQLLNDINSKCWAALQLPNGMYCWCWAVQYCCCQPAYIADAEEKFQLP